MLLRLTAYIAILTFPLSCGYNSSGAASSTSFTAEVISVHDGDTFTALVDGNVTRKIRLANIDAPELDQPHGEEAGRELSTLVSGRRVEVREQTIDRYGRTVGVVLMDGVDVCALMVTKGLAWVYTQYNKDDSLPALEAEARQSKRGLWVDDNPIPPWEWRNTGK